MSDNAFTFADGPLSKTIPIDELEQIRLLAHNVVCDLRKSARFACPEHAEALRMWESMVSAIRSDLEKLIEGTSPTIEGNIDGEVHQ